jgi:dCMP deaminase
MRQNYHDSEKWDRRFLGLADHVATWSKDPSSKVGAVVVGKTPNLLAVGYNGFPPGVEDADERLDHRPTKYDLVVHGEINALINAAFEPVSVYITCPPCIRCAVQILAYRSVQRVVTWAPAPDMLERWGADFDKTKAIFAEAGISYRSVER